MQTDSGFTAKTVTFLEFVSKGWEPVSYEREREREREKKKKRRKNEQTTRDQALHKPAAFKTADM